MFSPEKNFFNPDPAPVPWLSGERLYDAQAGLYKEGVKRYNRALYQCRQLLETLTAHTTHPAGVWCFVVRVRP
jgi:hypothetical protein